MNVCDKPIGVFDSGIGGISVLDELIKKMPHEHFIYLGDSKNAPYGIKTEQEIYNFALQNTKTLLDMGAKAIVIACNTATSVAAKSIRNLYIDTPIIGVEPALKPAALHKPNSNILVMATPVTLKNEKFCSLMKEYSCNSNIISMPCLGLVEIIEKGNINGYEIDNYLKQNLKEFENVNIDSVVLGCTHYVFIKDAIKKAFSENIMIFDGGLGTANETFRRISEKNISNCSKNIGQITLLNSNKSKVDISLYKKFLFSFRG